MLTHLLSDVRLALRGMNRRKSTSALLILTLGLGLGANAAIFSVLDALILRPLDFPKLDRLIRVWETAPQSDDSDQANVAPANFLDWQSQSPDVFESMVALESWGANLRGLDAPERVQGYRVSPSFFDDLGVRPLTGRAFLAEEGQLGDRLRVVIGDDLWKRSFAADPLVLSRPLFIDGEAYTVVGVAPPGFQFPKGSEIWAPRVLPAPGAARRDQHSLSVIGLLRPGRNLGEARAALAVVAARLQKDHPGTNVARGIRAETLSRGFEDPGLRQITAAWQIAAGLVLLIACVNVANFLLARGAERQHELSLRLALGASQSRIFVQLLSEGVVTALMSLWVALPIGALGAWELKRHLPAEIARVLNGWDGLGLDGRVALFTVVLALLAALVFSCVPALQASRPQLTEALKEGGRNTTTSKRGQRGRNALVVAQVAGALSLLVVASLAVRGARSIVSGPQGYNPEGLLALQVRLPQVKYGSPEERRAFARDVHARLQQLPGAPSVAYGNVLPARGNNSSRSILIEGAPVQPSHGGEQIADARSVSSGYLNTLGIPLLSGRDINARDGSAPDALQVAIVSQSFADRYWPGMEPLGRRFQVGGKDGPRLTVIGVSGDVIHHWFGRRDYPTYYRPYAQDPRSDVAFALRVKGDPEALTLEARRAVAAIDPYQPAYSVWSMRRSIAMATIGVQYVAGIMTVFGALAVVLALSGVYGVMSYRVSLRAPEIGVRMALGASSRDVLGLTMRQAMRLTTVGVLIGGGLGFWGARFLSSILGGIIAFDLPTFLLFTGILTAASVLAAYVPARRALRVDPAQALRAS